MFRAWFAVLLALVLAGCGKRLAPRQFGLPAGGEGGSDAAGAPQTGGGPPDAQHLGAACRDDAQCDDGIDCTGDHCDAERERCVHAPDSSFCANGVYCDGEETCDVLLGCVPGEPVACSDDTTCTIDTCVEATQTCQHEIRDADADGDPDGNCVGGADCDETDPTVSSLASEICGNGRDDDCDESVDEEPCEQPEHDVCADFLEVAGPVDMELPFAGVSGDYSASCAGDGWRDLVLGITTTEPTTVDVRVDGSGGLALASYGLCGDAASEQACARGAQGVPRGGSVARLLLPEPVAGTRVVKVFAADPDPVRLVVDYRSFVLPPENETCGTAAPLAWDDPFLVPAIGRRADLPTACPGAVGDLVYEFVLDRPQDLEVFAEAQDTNGEPILSLFGSGCEQAAQEISCVEGDPALLFARALPAGTYYLGVSATGPSEIEVQASLTPASVSPAGDTCDDAAPVTPGVAVAVPFQSYADDLRTSCLVTGVDAVFALSVPEPADVLLVQSLSDGDQAAVALLESGCSPDDELLCEVGRRSPVRAAARDLPVGDYRVVVESRTGIPGELLALVRPSAPPVIVGFADTCADAVRIPARGARLTGSTTGAAGDYAASCDRGSDEPSRAPDQMLQLVLTERQRVVLDMTGSTFETVLDIRQGPDCPGEEIELGCSAGFVAGRSFLDLVLNAGQYWVQIDGYEGDAGAWMLDVFVADP